MPDQTQAKEPPIGQSPDSAEPNKPAEKPGWLSSLISEATQGLRNLPSAVTQTVTHPITTARGALAAQGELATKAEDSFKQGDYVTGVRHAINYLLPLIGPRLD